MPHLPLQLHPSRLLEFIFLLGALNKEAREDSQHDSTMKYLTKVRTSGKSLGTASGLELCI